MKPGIIALAAFLIGGATLAAVTLPSVRDALPVRTHSSLALPSDVTMSERNYFQAPEAPAQKPQRL
jgi:hypothetical protein